MTDAQQQLTRNVTVLRTTVVILIVQVPVPVPVPGTAIVSFTYLEPVSTGGCE